VHRFDDGGAPGIALRPRGAGAFAKLRAEAARNLDVAAKGLDPDQMLKHRIDVAGQDEAAWVVTPGAPSNIKSISCDSSAMALSTAYSKTSDELAITNLVPCQIVFLRDPNSFTDADRTWTGTGSLQLSGETPAYSFGLLDHPTDETFSRKFAMTISSSTPTLYYWSEWDGDHHFPGLLTEITIGGTKVAEAHTEP
jgi:hypothetical protein